MTVHTDHESVRRTRIESIRERVVTRADLARAESRLKHRMAVSLLAGMTATTAIAAAAATLVG